MDPCACCARAYLVSCPQTNLDMLLRYFWSAALGIAPLVLVSISALEFYDVSKGKCPRSPEGGPEGLYRHSHKDPCA
jgi:hypothetical protein